MTVHDKLKDSSFMAMRDSASEPGMCWLRAHEHRAPKESVCRGGSFDHNRKDLLRVEVHLCTELSARRLIAA